MFSYHRCKGKGKTGEERGGGKGNNLGCGVDLWPCLDSCGSSFAVLALWRIKTDMTLKKSQASTELRAGKWQ